MADPRIGPLAVALRTARERAGMSQRQAAREADWHYSEISKLEAGQRAHVPDKEKLQRLDEAVGADGHLLRIAGYLDGNPEIEETLRAVIDKHIQALVKDLRRTIGE